MLRLAPSKKFVDIYYEWYMGERHENGAKHVDILEHYLPQLIKSSNSIESTTSLPELIFIAKLILNIIKKSLKDKIVLENAIERNSSRFLVF